MMTYLERCAKCGKVQADHRFALHRFERPGEMESDPPADPLGDYIDAAADFVGSAADFVEAVIEDSDSDG